MFYDAKGNLTTTPNFLTDRIIAINQDVQYYGGINNSFKYKLFQLDVFFQYAKQVGLNPLLGYGSVPGFFGFNTIQANLDRWQKPFDQTPGQMFTQSYSSPAIYTYDNAARSDFAYTDASFIRLKNISFSYALPGKILKCNSYEEL